MPAAPELDRTNVDRPDVDRPDVKVLIVDDQLPFRLAARTVIRRAPGFELVGEAASGEEAVTQVAALQPGLVLMDINMPGINGIEATRQIIAAQPDVVVFLCSTYALADLPPDATTSGATAYVNKEELAPDVIVELWDARGDGFSSVTS
jgi:two-component system, NarL family, invasion response regulator UvrY